MRPYESFVGSPVRSLQTMLRVVARDDSRLPSLIPDGIYGQQTMQAVSAFQRRYGLPPTGITNEETWNRLVEIYEVARIRVFQAQPVEVILEPSQVFRMGDSSPWLYLVQSMLVVLSKGDPELHPKSHTGVLDPGTAQAIRRFQSLSQLDSTGELDRVTWKYLSRQFTLEAARQSRGENIAKL